MNTKSVASSLLAAMSLGMTGYRTFAADFYPSRPIRLVVPSGAGGNTDFLARMLAEKLRSPLGQPVIVDNRSAASGIVGTELVAKAAPDGYTLLMVFPSHPVNPSLYSDLPYDTIKDFAPITMVSTVTQVLLVNSKSPAKSVKELIALAAQRPGQLNYGAVGRGSLGDLSARLFGSIAGIELVPVFYKSAPQIMTALIQGELQIYFSPPVVAVPQIKSERVRALGVSTKARLAIIPDVPTIAESGLPGFEVVGWNGILAPAKTPRSVIDRLHKEIVAVLRSADVEAQIAAQGIEPLANTPEEFGRIIRADVEKWARVLKGARIKVN
ncbi:MAG TPA: tripartite tricarboxylate transporter substrate binding protein [Burkholderiales bacterium]|jgi:tripartite-type tricarboxylate transporter receptor subunit TctC|nr:tripartite tricarboxylate transporter substrate binding protein [Burkholderiales bacterium]